MQPPTLPSWSATDRRGRRLLTVAAGLATIAVLIGIQAARLDRPHQLRRVAGPPVAMVDAAGCPVDAHCASSSTAPPALLAAVSRYLPDSRVDAVSVIADAGTGRPYRVSVVAHLPGGGDLSLIAQRLPGGPINDPPYLASTDRSHTDLAGNRVVDAHLLRAVVPGAPGCSIGLTLSYHSAGQPTLDRAAGALARDPAVQLSP